MADSHKTDAVLDSTDSVAVRRWENLIQWWESATGRSLGRFPQTLPLDVSIDQVNVKTGWWLDWYPRPDGAPAHHLYGQDPEVCEVLMSVQDEKWDALAGESYFDFSLPLPPDLKDWWRWGDMGQAEVNRRAKLHEDLVMAARAVLSMDVSWEERKFGPDGSWVLSTFEEIPDYQGSSWDVLVSPEAVKAAFLLATLPNPYPTASGRGRKPIVQGVTAARRAVVKALDRLTKTNGQRLSDSELTVFCLLAKPYYFLKDQDCPPPYLSGLGDWKPKPNPKSVRTDSLFKSDGFRNLVDTVRKDRAFNNKTINEFSQEEIP